MMNLKSAQSVFFYIIITICFDHTNLYPRIIEVGADKTYKRPSEAASVCSDGDTVLIDAGEYVGDVTAWYNNNLVIRGVGGRAHIRANGNNAQGKGTWIVAGNNATVENIEFSEASVPDQNGAGIRADGAGLTIKNCYFHDNEDGILGPEAGELLIEYSEFAHNGYGDGQSHNMYILGVDKFTIRYSYTHHAKIGHNIKTRAKVNIIEYNRVMDEQDGTSSYAIDVPDGGLTYIIGNLLQQGPEADNSTIVAYGAESSKNQKMELYFINNSMVNDRESGTFIYVRSGTYAVIQNNIFAKNGNVLSGSATLLTNLITDNPGFIDINNFDYRLKSGSDAINNGSDPGTANDFGLKPVYEYVHPTQKTVRNQVETIDIGAYEYNSASVLENNHNRPLNFSLNQNYPNPFNPATTISFVMQEADKVKIDIYDLRGRYIQTLVEKMYGPGRHQVDFEPGSIASGVYYYIMKTSSFRDVKKMVLLR